MVPAGVARLVLGICPAGNHVQSGSDAEMKFERWDLDYMSEGEKYRT